MANRETSVRLAARMDGQPILGTCDLLSRNYPGAGQNQNSAVAKRRDESFRVENARHVRFSEWSVGKGVTTRTAIGKRVRTVVSGAICVLRKARKIATVSRGHFMEESA